MQRFDEIDCMVGVIVIANAGDDPDCAHAGIRIGRIRCEAPAMVPPSLYARLRNQTRNAGEFPPKLQPIQSVFQ